jgi:two-component system response regulator
MERMMMVVEDNSDDIVLIQRAFKKCCLGNKMVVARDGIEALEYLFEKHEDSDQQKDALPAVVLMDVKMPRMDGLETLKHIRSHSRTAYLPVVMLTSSDEERDKIQSYKLGANSYIRKPVNFDQFLAVMRQLGLYWLTINELPEQ